MRRLGLSRRVLPLAFFSILAAAAPMWAQDAAPQDAAPQDAEAPPPLKLKVHYHRFDGEAGRWALWYGREGEKGSLAKSAGRDESGDPIFELPVGDSEALWFVPKRPGSRPRWDGPARRWSSAQGRELWIREGDPRTHEAPALSAFASEAYAESASVLFARFRGGLPEADQIEVVSRRGVTIPVLRIEGGDPARAGYKRDGADWLFIYDAGVLGGGLDGDKGIALVGDFNGWKKAAGKRRWRLSWNEQTRRHELRVPAAHVPAGAQFKYKQLGGGWAPNGGNLQVREARGRKVILSGAMSFDDRYEIRGKDVKRGVDVVPRGWLHSEMAFYDCDRPLGALCQAEATSFRLFAPTASAVELRLWSSPKGGEPRRVALQREDEGCWAVTVEGELHGKYYAFGVDAPGLDPRQDAIDPYARSVTGKFGRGMVLDLRRTDPEGFRAHQRPDFLGVVKDGSPNSPEDAVIYEGHIRDLTIDAASGIKNRGRYLGLTETGTRGPGGVKTGLDHMVELGVTHVQILPFQDFDNDEASEQYNWGYMPANFNSPEGWYASRRDDATRVVEAKRMVQAIHGQGLRVVLDVVYNHTSGIAAFDKVAPFYYFRMRPFSESPYWNGSGCGNEFRSESPMGRRFIVDSIRYWAEEYKVDGFRFDLMGLIDRQTMVEVTRAARGVDPSLLVYGEPWTGGDTPIQKTEKGSQRGVGFGVFNDHFRDAIKGGHHDGAKGFVQNPHRAVSGKVKNGLEGATNLSAGGFAGDPGETINYVACHDNKTLWDKISEDKSIRRSDRVAMARLSGALVLLSQGIPFLHAGQDFLRSKRGEHNSYNLSDAINKIDWQLKRKNLKVFRYHQGLISLRKAHPLFRLSSTGEILGARLRFLPGGNDATFGYSLDGKELEGETWDAVLVLFNAARGPAELGLPAGRWTIVADKDEAGLGPVKTGPSSARGRLKMEGLSAYVLRKSGD